MTFINFVFRFGFIVVFITTIKLNAQNFDVIGNAFSIPTVQNSTCTDADTCFTLTPNSNWQQGAVWDLDTIDLSIGFDATFCMFLGDNDGGADGFAFVMRSPSSNSYGEEGGALGYGTDNGTSGISPSVAIEFDSFYNSNFFDIQEDHTQLVLNGDVSLPPAVSAISLLPGSQNVEDNNFHTSRIVWDPLTQNLSMYFDGNLRFTYNNDLINNVFGGNQHIFWGFTASTGGMTNLQQICFPKIDINIPDQVICSSDSTYIHYYYDNLTSYVWVNPNQDTIISWNSSLGTPLIDTGFYANIEGDYTITIEFNNHIYSENVHVTLIGEPIDTTINLCLNNGNFNLLSLFTNPPTDGTWSGPSNLTNGIQGTFNPTLNQTGSYIYTSDSLAVCPQDFYTVDVTIITVDFNPTIELIPCSETEYEVEVNPLMSTGNTNFQYNWSSISSVLVPNGNSCLATINSNQSIQVEILSLDVNACEFDTSLQLQFVSNPQFSLGNDITVCEDETVTINALGTWDSFLWNDGNTLSSIQVNTSGIYWCEVESSNSCIFRDSIEIIFSPLPVITVLPFDSTACNPHQLDIEANVNPANSTINWVFDDGETYFNQSSLQKSYSNSGDYGFEITAISPDMCVSQITLIDVIHVLSSPIADFSYQILSNIGGNADIEFFNNSVNYSNFTWTFNNLDSSNIENLVLNFDADNQIEVELFASNGNCSDSVIRYIEIPGELIYYVPNSFTPDGNFFNNVFLPILTDGIDLNSYHLLIFDRWGELIFESFNPEIGWDGTYGNRLVQDGTYVWQMFFTELESKQERKILGHINLMK